MATIMDTTTCTPKRIAMYVIFDKDGILDGFRKYYLQELRKEVDCIVGVVQGNLTSESFRELEELTDDIFVRENTGLLTYAWIEGIKHIGWDKLAEYDELLMLNDSFFGPFFPLKDFFDACEHSEADFYGVMRIFELKSIKKVDDHCFKHGYLRGSVCYFYVIKEKLLHSEEFKMYWSQKPEIKKLSDTNFFNEFDFYDFVVDSGFKVETYQNDSLRNYYYDNLTHNMYKLVKNNKIPYARIRPFISDLKNHSMHIGYGQDVRNTIEYIDKKTEYDVNLMWDYILRTSNMTNIYNQLQLNYIVSSAYTTHDVCPCKRIAAIIHIYYKDQVNVLYDYCKNLPEGVDYYISTTSTEVMEEIQRVFSSKNVICKIKPNVGVAESTFWVTYSDVIVNGDYDYICFLHDKKSAYFEFSMVGEQFAHRLYENLLGSADIVRNIINIFENNPRLGMLGAPCPYHGPYFASAERSWPVNYENTINLAKKLHINVPIDKNITPVAPYGTMFWFRPKAILKHVKHGFTYEDFNVEYKPDSTLMHAIERIYTFCVQDSGYYYATVINDDYARSDISNYQYMMSTICDILLKKDINIYSFDILKNYLMESNIYGEWKRLIKFLVKIKYYKYKILSKITFGKARKRYKIKKRQFRELVNHI